MREEETKWWNPPLSLPTQEELIPISQTLIPTNLAVAFDIIPPTDPSLKRPRLVWTPQLHRRFVDAVVQLGIRNAVPKTIMQMMGVEGLTRENIASHLQKYRQYLKRIGSGLAGGDPAMDRLFSSSPVPAMFLQQSRENLSPFSAVGAVGDLGFRGVAGNGSVSNGVSDHSFLMGQSHISRENLSHFPPLGGSREQGFQQGVFRGVVGNGSVSNGVLDHLFLMGQSQQSISSRENFSHLSSVDAPQELGFQQGEFRGVAGNGFVSISGLDHSFLMGQSQQNGRSRDDLLPFSAVGMVWEQGIQQGGYTGSGGSGGTGSRSNRILDRSFLMGRSQVYASSPMYVDDMMNGDSGGARRVLTLFPTGEDD